MPNKKLQGFSGIKPGVRYTTRSSELMTGCNINVSTEQVIASPFTPKEVKEKRRLQK